MTSKDLERIKKEYAGASNMTLNDVLQAAFEAGQNDIRRQRTSQITGFLERQAITAFADGVEEMLKASFRKFRRSDIAPKDIGLLDKDWLALRKKFGVEKP